MKFSIATFNVENLVGANKTIYDETTPRYNDMEYAQKVAWINYQLNQMNADIIGFQEVFEEQALMDCLAGSKFENWNLYVANANGKTPVNAILSRFPFEKVEVISDIPFVFDFFDEQRIATFLETSVIEIPIKTFSRNVLRATIILGESLAITIYVLHLKSKNPILQTGVTRETASYPELAKGQIRSLIRRGIEAAGLRELLSKQIEANDTMPIVIVGDLNDNDTAVTNQSILGEPPFFQLPPQEKIKRWKHVFQNCKDIQARKSIENFHYTYIHNGHFESLDNVFVSNHFSELNNDKIGRIIDIRLYNDHVIDGTISKDRKPKYASDHGQVVANFQLLESSDGVLPLPNEQV